LFRIINMKKFPLVIILATILIVVGGIFLMSKSSTPPPLPSNLEYFWGEGCPHCKNVADFMNSWKKSLPADRRDQVKIDKFEVRSSTNNAALMEARYKYCKITDRAEMGVPLLFTPEGKCFSGDTPIIDYLKNL